MSDPIHTAGYASRTPSDYLAKIKPEILSSFNAEQLAEIQQILSEAIPKPSPKLVDLRFVVDLIVSRFYIVLFVGKDRRSKPRRHIPAGIAKVGNRITAVILLIGANLIISAVIVLAGYLVKSAIGINLLPGHFPDLVKHVFGIS